MKTPYGLLIATTAKAHGLDPDLVEAVVVTESSGHADAFRFEPDFYARYLRDKPEYRDQIPRRVASSYGLMQLMYPTARELGFKGEPEFLFFPDTNLEWGCTLLVSLLRWASGDIDMALEAYNGGKGSVGSERTRAYARKVRGHLAAIVRERRNLT